MRFSRTYYYITYYLILLHTLHTFYTSLFTLITLGCYIILIFYFIVFDNGIINIGSAKKKEKIMCCGINVAKRYKDRIFSIKSIFFRSVEGMVNV